MGSVSIHGAESADVTAVAGCRAVVAQSLPAARATGRRSVRMTSHAGHGGGASKRRASAPAAHHQQMLRQMSRLEPLHDAACSVEFEVPTYAAGLRPPFATQPMDCAAPALALQGTPWQAALQSQQHQQHLSLAAAGGQPTPPVTPAAVEGLSPARSPAPPRNGSAGDLLPGLDPGPDWPLGVSWGSLRSLRTAADGSIGGADGGLGAQHDSRHAATIAGGSPTSQHGALLPESVSRQGAWQGGRTAAAPEPLADGGVQAAAGGGANAPAGAAAAPPGEVSRVAPRRGSTALTAANIEWLRHVDPLELYTMGLPK